MKIVFDENVPWPLRKFLPDYEVTSVQRLGYAGVENGELIEALDGNFDAFILADKNLRYQQNLDERIITIIELPTNRWPILRDMKSQIREAVLASEPGAYFVIESEK